MTERFDLRYPFTNEEGVEIDALNLRRATVGDMELMDNEKSDYKRSKKLLELLAALTPKEILLLDAVDWERANEKMASFFHSDPEPSDQKKDEE